MQRASGTILITVLLLGLLLFQVGCDSTNADEEEFPDPELTLVEDLPADPFTGFAENGQPVGLNTYTFYSLRENLTVAVEDSASTTWDVAFKGTTILINGGSSGPGDGEAQVVDGLFEELVEAPLSGWEVDTEAGTAIPTGSGSGWYNYNPSTHMVTPVPGRIILIRTADGRYAKMRIVSYYQGAPQTPDSESKGRYYTFDFVFQPDGSRNLQ